MIHLPIKPLSVNECWKGKRFRTSDYNKYEDALMLLLPKITVPSGKLKLSILLGFSSKAADADNPIKPLVDILQKAYGFNDKNIYEYSIRKVDVEKGKEFIDFEIIKIDC